MTDNTEKIRVNFLIDDAPAFSKKIIKNQTLAQLRIEYSSLIKDEYIFLTNDKFEISRDDENDYRIEESLIDNKIYLKCEINNTTEPKEEIKLNTPIETSQYLYEKNNLKIYLYPTDKLTEEEEKRTTILMVVGQTGSGKTTLLNSLVNFLLGIQLEDNFRYKIIFEENDHDQSHSITKNIMV